MFLRNNPATNPTFVSIWKIKYSSGMVLTRDDKAAIVDGLLRFVASGGFITTALLLPNAAQIFDKPLVRLLKSLDDRSRERELRRITHYMKQKGLISYKAGDYEHGIKLTPQGKARIKRSDYTALAIPAPKKWDGRWRLIFFDVPMESDAGRHSFTYKLRNLGFQQLQKSIWIHPYPCRPEIETVTQVLGIRKFVTYVEISEIDSEPLLRKRFKNLLSTPNP